MMDPSATSASESSSEGPASTTTTTTNSNNPDTHSNVGVRVGIIGCGMAGPVLALFLKARGYDPVLYERSPSPSPSPSSSSSGSSGRGGLAITLQPNGLRVLRLLPEAYAALPGVRLTSMRILSTVLNHDSNSEQAAHTDSERHGLGDGYAQKQKQPQPHPAVPLAHTHRPAHAGAEGDDGAEGGGEGEGEGEGLGWRTAKREALQRHLVACAEHAGIKVHWGWALDGLCEVREVRKGEQGRQPQGGGGGGGGKDKGDKEGEDGRDGENEGDEEEEVEMHFTNGHTARASFVVGCDGLHSSVRAALFGAEAPKFTGIVQTGGFSPISHTDPDLGLEAKGGGATLVQCYGLNAFFITIPVSADTRVWALSTREGETRESWRAQDEATRAAFLAAQAGAGWGMGIDEIIQRSENLVKYGLYDRPELEMWHKGRVVLLGDAAHPTTPHIGQGANQAFEDIYHLVLALQQHHPHPPAHVSCPPTTTQLRAAFAAYEQTRRARTAHLVARARGHGDMRVVGDVAKAQMRDDAVRRRWLDEDAAWAEWADYARGPYVGHSELQLSFNDLPVPAEESE